MDQNKKLQVGGNLNPRKHVYIVRQDVEDKVFDLLSQGEYCNILSPRQVGKSSLMNNLILRLREQSVRTVSLDIASELGSISDSNTWYQGLLGKIVRDLCIQMHLKEWWAEQYGTPNQKLVRFFLDIVLGGDTKFQNANTAIVIFIDEIDATLKLPYTDDFFVALRGMYNSRATESVFEQLTFCLIGVAGVNELIKDRRTTPYNIGHTVVLRDIDPAQGDDFSGLLKFLHKDAQQAKALLDTVLEWTSGHPYLTLSLCQKAAVLADTKTLEQYIQDTYSNLDSLKGDAHFTHIANFLENRVTNPLASLKLYQQVLSGNCPGDKATSHHIQLKLSGLVVCNQDGCLESRNRIYKQLFNLEWINQTKPKHAQKHLRRFAIAVTICLAGTFSWIGYDKFWLEPPRKLAKHLEVELNSCNTPQEAKKLYQYFVGEKTHSVLGRRLAGYEKKADEIYSDFWSRHLIFVFENTQKNIISKENIHRVN